MMQMQNDLRWLNRTTAVGGLFWVILWVIHRNTPTLLTEVELLLVFGVAVITPLAMRLALNANRHGKVAPIYQAAIQFQPAALIAVGIALLLTPGLVATSFAVLWQIQTLMLACYGLSRLLQRAVFAVEEVCIDVGLLYVSVSGVWLLAYCAGYPLLTFDTTFVLLTAVHFTFISLGALVIAGMVGRQLYGSRVWPIYRVIACLIVASPALVAAGITMTQFSGRLWLEAGSVIILAGSFLLLALMCFFGELPEHSGARALIVASAGGLLVTMGLALAYSLGRLTGQWSLSIAQMVQWHGWLNALGFTFLGLLAWNMVAPTAKIAPPGIPFSQLPWRWFIGPGFFQRVKAINDSASPHPTGIVDHLEDYRRTDFEPLDVIPSIRAFYEDTQAHKLLVYPEWKPVFGALARIYKQFSKRMGQMNFPIQPESHETNVSSTIVPIDDALDGRERVRGWVRVYTDTGQASYVAAYTSHTHNQCRYMNIAFPLPFGNLTSILHLETPAENDGGLLLTSISTRHSDQGVYFATRFLVVRLPINETIRVYPGNASYSSFPAGFPVSDVLAEHKMWLLGRHFLTLHYSISQVTTE